MAIPRNFRSLSRKFKRRTKELLKLGVNPDFMIIGAQKCGTTSLYEYICEYSDNFIKPMYKEIQYFSKYYLHGDSYYRSHYPTKLKPGQITGEASPTYLFYPKAPEYLAKSSIPTKKFVVILRDPVFRAFSHYNFFQQTKVEAIDYKESFRSALANEDSRIDLTTTILDRKTQIFSYKTRGLYYAQLSNWFLWYKRENFFIIDFDDLVNDTLRIVRETFDFLGLELSPLAASNEFKPRNTKKIKTNPICEDDMSYLANYFKEPNQKLFQLIGREFNWV